jgi:hypothetical protein
MKYSKQQLSNINRNYDDMRMRARLQNLKSNALQNVIVDKQIPVDLLDRRNINDIENDKFFRKAVLNEYSNKILPVQEIHDFHQSLKDNNLETFFIQNFPKIQTETKMFKYIDGDDLFKITKRLYNKDIKELDEDKELKYKKQNMEDTMTILKEILTTLQGMPMSRDVKNKTNKVKAIIETAQYVDNNGGEQETFFDNLFGDNDIEEAIDTISAPAIDNAMEQIMPDLDPNDGYEEKNAEPEDNEPEEDVNQQNAVLNKAIDYNDAITLSEDFMNEAKFANFLISLTDTDIESSKLMGRTSKSKMTAYFNKKAKIGKDIKTRIKTFYTSNWNNLGNFRTIGSALKKYGFVYDPKKITKADVHNFLNTFLNNL